MLGSRRLGEGEGGRVGVGVGLGVGVRVTSLGNSVTDRAEVEPSVLVDSVVNMESDSISVGKADRAVSGTGVSVGTVFVVGVVEGVGEGGDTMSGVVRGGIPDSGFIGLI